METRMPVMVADDPLTCVVRGAGIMVESLEDEKYRQIIAASQEGRRIKQSR
jgi:rod shape-determining protein MreB